MKTLLTCFCLLPFFVFAQQHKPKTAASKPNTVLSQNSLIDALVKKSKTQKINSSTIYDLTSTFPSDTLQIGSGMTEGIKKYGVYFYYGINGYYSGFSVDLKTLERPFASKEWLLYSNASISKLAAQYGKIESIYLSRDRKKRRSDPDLPYRIHISFAKSQLTSYHLSDAEVAQLQPLLPGAGKEFFAPSAYSKVLAVLSKIRAEYASRQFMLDEVPDVEVMQ